MKLTTLLVLGHKGMLGNAVVKYFSLFPNKYSVKTIDIRYGEKGFIQSIKSLKPEVVINCIGIIPQKKPSISLYKKINNDLPQDLEKLGIKVVHPSTDCEFSGLLPVPSLYTKESLRDADDEYGKSKAVIARKIETRFKNTKVIRTSIIGHEIKSNVALLDWFLCTQGEVSGFTNKYWNGITTLMWAKLCEDLIQNWNTRPIINQYSTGDCRNKYELLTTIKKVYGKEDCKILPKQYGLTENKCLVSDKKLPSIEKQLYELKHFYENYKRKNKTILVTGCTGFIGGNFITAYKKKNKGVRIIGLSTATASHARTDIPADFIYKGSVTDPILLREIFERHEPQYVVHLAGNSRVSFSSEEPAQSTQVNLVGTLNLLEISRNFKVSRFIYCSSVAVYDGLHKMPLTENKVNEEAKNFYSLQKITIEKFCTLFSTMYGLDTITLRLFQTFGPYQYGYSSAISTWLESLYFPNAKKPFLEGDGSQARDFCYIDNVTSALAKAVDSKKVFRGQACNISGGKSIMLKDIIDRIEKYSGKKLSLDYKPPRKDEVMNSYADISLAKELLGYEPYVDFDTGLKRTVAWFKKRKN